MLGGRRHDPQAAGEKITFGTVGVFGSRLAADDHHKLPVAADLVAAAPGDVAFIPDAAVEVTEHEENKRTVEGIPRQGQIDEPLGGP